MRDFLKGLDFDGELIDTIMAEYGKLVSKDKEELQSLKSQMKELEEKSKNATELQDKYNELVKINEEREAKQKQEEEEKVLEESINSLFEGKTFTSDYARQGLLNDIKNGIKNPTNKGKGVRDLFDELTKDKTDIFTNPNEEQKDMTGMGDSEQETNIKQMPTIW